MALLELLFPLRCISCSQGGSIHCERCALNWSRSPRLGAVDSLPLLWVARYSPEVARVLLAAKEDSHRQSQKIIARTLDRTLEGAVQRGLIAPMMPIFLVPIPSSPRNTIKRGHFHLKSVARYMTSEFTFLDILETNRQIKDQSGLTSNERSINIGGAYQVKPQWGSRARSTLRLNGGVVVLCDDLVTTGSSLREAVRALKVAKISPGFAISACAVRAH